MKDIIDISQKLEADTQVYPGDPQFSCCGVATIKEHGYNVCSLSLGTHTGTHIDAPYHFVGGGKSVDELDLSLLVGPAAVIDLSSKASRERITWDDLECAGVVSLLGGRKILFVRTGWSRHWKSAKYLDHPFLDGRVAEKLLEIGVQVLGVDALSPDETAADSGPQGDFGFHETFLGAGALIVENLAHLDQLPEHVFVSLLPLNLVGCDGSPIRAVAWTE